MKIRLTALIICSLLALGGNTIPSSQVMAQTDTQKLPSNLKGRHDKPYDNQLIRLAELLGAIHYLRELCGANDGQKWRDQMADLVKAEGTTAVRRVKLVNSFNKGYRGYRRTYRSCTRSARLAVDRSIQEGAAIANTIVTSNQ